MIELATIADSDISYLPTYCIKWQKLTSIVDSDISYLPRLKWQNQPPLLIPIFPTTLLRLQILPLLIWPPLLYDISYLPYALNCRIDHQR
jgi:hypothetical protein